MRLAKSTFVITMLLVPLVAVASLLALLLEGVYPGLAADYAVAVKGSDLVTLAFIVPLLFGGLIQAYNGALRGYLLLTGALGYVVYTFGAYAFLLPWGPLFYPHVVILSLGSYGFITAMAGMRPGQIVRLAEHTPLARRMMAGMMIFFSLAMILIWVGGTLLMPLLAGAEGAEVAASFRALRVYQVLDLAFVLPLGVLAAVLLLKQTGWGHVLTPIFLVKAATILLMVLGGEVFLVASGGETNLFTTIFFVAFFAAVVAALVVDLNGLAEGSGD
jgi:hypothetical protein